MNEPESPQHHADSATNGPGAVQGGHDTAQAFISYASADSSIANSVCHALEREGVKCWIAPRDVTPGELYAPNIVHAIDTTRVVVLVLSQHAADSAHVHREVERASSKRHPVVSFRIDLAPLPDGLEYFLNTSQWLDASATGVDRALPKLVDAVKSVLAKSTIAAPVHQAPIVAPRAEKRTSRVILTLAVVLAAALAYVAVDRFWLRYGAQQALVEATPALPADSSGSPGPPATSTISANTIAVLPFVNMSSDKEQEYFSDGLSEELLNLLTKVPELQVAARTSSFYYKGKDVKLTDVARELRVAHLLEGSVRKSGNRVRITAQLIRASDGYHKWSETYDRTLDDIFAVQEEIAAAVVSQLKIRLLSAPPKARETSPEAHALYLQALQLNRLGTGRFDESIALYRQALAIDPNYALAWIGLGSNYAGQANLAQRPLAEGMERAREAFKKALAIDPEYGRAHAGLGWIALNYDLDLAAAAKHFERALALDPANPDVLATAFTLNVVLDRRDSQLELAEYLLSRDPMAPGKYAYLANVHQNEGRLDDAIANYRTALKLSPEMAGAHAGIGDCLLLKGDYEAALIEYEKEQTEPQKLAGLASVYHRLGDRSKSDAALAELIKKHPDWAGLIAITFADLGQKDQAFAWLEKAAVNRDTDLNGLAWNPWFKNLHDDPRWLPFLRRLGKAPEQLAAIKFELKVPQH